MRTNEITFTPEEDVVFDAAWDFDELPGFDAPYLYHYRSGGSLYDIFRPDNIYLRFTRGDSFPDKMEGKAVEAYYDLAIEDLKDRGKISVDQYNRIIDIAPPSEMLAREERNGLDFYTRVNFTPYIFCFSTSKDDPYMFDTVSDAKEMGKFFFSMDTTVVKQLTHLGRKNGVRFKLEQILYGKDVVSYIQKKVLYLLEHPELYTAVESFLQDYLHNLQYMAKMSKFRKENEVRLIIYVPKQINTSHPNIVFDDKDVKHLRLIIPKSYVWDLFSNISNDETRDNELRTNISHRGYPYALRKTEEVFHDQL